MRRAALYLTYGSAISILFSIAVSQILLGLGICVLLIAGQELKFPPIKLPLALFFGWTVIATLLSPDPAAGIPQIRKFFVFTMLLLICSTFQQLSQIRLLFLGWTAVALISGVASLVQFLGRREEATRLQALNYDYVVDGRTTGLSSHWLTFGGEEMIVLILVVAFLLFAPAPGWKRWGWIGVAFLWTALVLNLSRSVFLLGLPVGVLYLCWKRSPKAVAVVPVIAVATFLLSPAYVRERMTSIVRPRGVFDLNGDRAVARLVGFEMVKAHPWFGIGPEQIGRQFEQWVPRHVRRPLPRGWYGHLHNIYLQYAAERGVPALLFLMWMVLKALVDFRRELLSRPDRWAGRFVLHGATAVILAILAEGFFEHNLGDSEILTMFLSVIACGYVACRDRENCDPVANVLFPTYAESGLTG